MKELNYSLMQASQGDDLGRVETLLDAGSCSNANPSVGTSRKVLNLTQHVATPDQVEAGVYEPEVKAEVQALLTFEELPSTSKILNRAIALAELAVKNGAESAMIGGAPYLMAPLEAALRELGITPLYAFSTRRSVDQAMPDGSIRKVAVFCHQGFVEAVHTTLMGWTEIEA